MVRYLTLVLFRCQQGLHDWVWNGTYDKRLRCADCGVIKP